ncbi:MAG: C39 family peptidase [Gammaproteobacteria bacterium]|nr:C39 family peptidase [Gammaproteobacteria bacterium]
MPINFNRQIDRHPLRPAIRLLSCCAIALSLSGCASVSELYPMPLSSNGIRFEKQVKTWRDILRQNIVMQKFDYSCGAAALATIMRYYFQDAVKEREILDDIMAALDEADVENRKEKGLSLLDLKNYAERKGYIAMGVRLKFTALPKLRGPVLVYLETSEYKHFAILRGVREDRVFLADPSRGNLRMSVEKFAGEWPGIALVLGKKGFGAPIGHPLAIREESPVLTELITVRQALSYRVPFHPRTPISSR